MDYTWLQLIDLIIEGLILGFSLSLLISFIFTIIKNKKNKMMKKKLFILLIAPMLMATQCEDDIGCTSETFTKSKPNLIVIENLQPTYNVGDIIWIESNLNRNINFNNSNETIDLFNFKNLAYKFNFDRLSNFDSALYLCVNENTIDIINGELLNCNQIIYEKTNTNLISKIGIKLLDIGNFRIRASEISNNDCDNDSISILTTFSNSNEEWITFSVE